MDFNCTMTYLPFPSKETIEKTPLFFIIGRSRSGTTLLKAMLDAHKNILVPVECTFILQLAGKYGKYKRWDKELIDRYISDLPSSWLYYYLKIHTEILRETLNELGPDIDYLTVCKAVIFHTPVIYPKNAIFLLGDKNPSYSLQFKRLYKLFGTSCKYIHIVRDYRDQFTSVRNARIEIPNISVSTKRWVFSLKSMSEFKRQSTGNFHTLRYEDLVSKPEEEINKICGFLGVGYEPEMLQFSRNKDKLTEAYSPQLMEGIHKSLLNNIGTDKIGTWKTELTKTEKGIAEYIAGKQGLALGYELSGEKKRMKYFFLSMPGKCIYYFSQFAAYILRQMPFKIYIKLSAGAYFGSLWNKYLRK